MYLIELDRWNIKQGLPAKPYKDQDYIMADKNIQGINNAIQYAYNNGYTKVVLPRGQYALCYPREIIMLSNMTFDLNGSTLKVIYDSDRKSPFDNRVTNDYYNFKGNSIVFDNVTNAHVIGGTIIGCRNDRSFSNVTEESKVENTYGVLFRKSTSYCSIRYCTVSDYMGDNITFSSTAIKELTEPNMNISLNTLNYTTGQISHSTNTLTTGFINIPSEFSSFLIAGAGYSRVTALNSREVDVFFYKADNTFIGVLEKRKIYSDISVPKNATKMRLLFSNEADPSKKLQITLKFGLIPHHNIVEYNEIYNGHRGGITLGGSYNIIQHNVVRDNGKGSNSFLDGKPIFPYTTRYSINQEDSYGDNCVIRNNLIYGSFHGILAGCYSIQIENNHIYNMESYGISLYNLLFANVKGNFIYKCSNPIGFMTTSFPNTFVNVSENYIYGGRLYLNSNNIYKINFSNNNLTDVTYINMGNNNSRNSFKNNRIKFDNISVSPIIIVNNLENCYFDSTTVRKVLFNAYIQNRCNFNNIIIDMQTRDTKIIAEKILLYNCEFNNCILMNHIFLTKDREVKIRNSKLVDSIIKVGNINTEGSIATISLEDCNIEASTIKNIFATDFNQPSGNIQLYRCNVKISNPSFSYLIDHDKIAKANFSLFLKKSNFIYTGVNPLNLKYYNNKDPMISFVSADSVFTNIILPPEDAGIYYDYDIENTYKATVKLQIEGTNKYSTSIIHNLNTTEPYVFCTSSSIVVKPTVTIVDSNTIKVEHSDNTNLSITIKKI